MTNKKNVAFLGLGCMGYHIAGHLAQSPDVAIAVWNRSQDKLQQWGQEYGKYNAQIAASIADCVQAADVVLLCAGRDEDVEEMVYAEHGVLPSIRSHAMVIDHTTTSCQLARKLAASFAQKGVAFVDAPVSGGEIGAINGCLSVMAGGDDAAIRAAMPLLQCYAKNISHIGASGYGQLAKMTNQICIAGILQGLSEAILFAEHENIDLEKLLAAISTGAAQSWQMDNRAATMHRREFDFGFAIKWMIKDLGYCLDRAAENGAELPFAEAVYHKYRVLAKEGRAELDTSALILQQSTPKALFGGDSTVD